MHKRSLKGNLHRSKRSLKTTRVNEDEVIKLHALKTRLVRDILRGLNCCKSTSFCSSSKNYCKMKSLAAIQKPPEIKNPIEFKKVKLIAYVTENSNELIDQLVRSQIFVKILSLSLFLKFFLGKARGHRKLATDGYGFIDFGLLKMSSDRTGSFDAGLTRSGLVLSSPLDSADQIHSS
ncbi:hypothetical protein M9H77_26088 [Catharanthus roseus]|uniref:Uncharacterized protein n=1 Tax=Catharanthus roseus TaxID=4058 RepID=A0ACC0A8T5_CATRO|nr:hypothetical protein M9H77_26088 [Catharanthus roseus]